MLMYLGFLLGAARFSINVSLRRIRSSDARKEEERERERENGQKNDITYLFARIKNNFAHHLNSHRGINLGVEFFLSFFPLYQKYVFLLYF